MINTIVLMGRITADPELKTAGNSNVCKFRLAVERPFVGQDGQRQTDFISCQAWGKSAEFISKYFRKGQLIAVEGSLRQETYKTQDGQERSNYVVNVNSASFCGREQSQTQEQPQAAKPAPVAPSAPKFDSQPEPEQVGFNEDDSLPF